MMYINVYPGIQAHRPRFFPTEYIHWSRATKLEMHFWGGRAPPVGFSWFLPHQSWHVRWFCEGQVAGLCSVRGCAGWPSEGMLPKPHRKGLFPWGRLLLTPPPASLSLWGWTQALGENVCTHLYQLHFQHQILSLCSPMKSTSYF